MSTAMPSDVEPSARVLAEPAMRRALVDFVRRRVSPSDVDDIVQTVLVEALASASRPADSDELRRWLLGIARHKVVDHHRRASRETASELPDVAVAPPPLEARALALWAEQQAGASRDAQSTLEWMAREGEGEKLESIAAEEKLPAARIRQRVSRMRRWMKERWLAELAAAAALVVAAIVLWRLFHRDDRITQPLPEPRPQPSIAPEQPVLEQARALRDAAFESCERAAWKDCLDKLDQAKSLDPAGDSEPRVGAARARATEALQPKQAPTSTPTVTTNEPPPVQKSAPTEKKIAPAPPAKPQVKAPSKPVPTPKSDDSPFQKRGTGKSKK